MMFETIPVYITDEPLLKPKEGVKLMIIGRIRKLVTYNAPIVEVDYGGKILERLERELGSVPLSNRWGETRAVRNIVDFPDQKIGVILLNQSIRAGIGNILRNEILFRAGVHPEKAIANLLLEEIERIVNFTEKLSKEFLSFRTKVLENCCSSTICLCKVCGYPIRFYIQNPSIGRLSFVKIVKDHYTCLPYILKDVVSEYRV